MIAHPSVVVPLVPSTFDAASVTQCERAIVEGTDRAGAVMPARHLGGGT